MDKPQATTILQNLLSILNEKGEVRVAPKEYGLIAQAVSLLTVPEVAPKATEVKK